MKRIHRGLYEYMGYSVRRMRGTWTIKPIDRAIPLIAFASTLARAKDMIDAKAKGKG